MLPQNAPAEYIDRAALWNAVEKIEKNRNSQLAREIEIALPTELSAEQNLFLVREYCKQHFVANGMCADICIHENDGNPHTHIMLTMRPFEEDGSWAAKSKKEYILDENGEKIQLNSGEYKSKKVNTVDWNEQTKAEEWRSGWAELCNQYLAENNIAQRIDHRSYERQDVLKIPAIHLGVAASAMEKRGIATNRGNINRQIEVTNKELRQLRARINKLKIWLETETKSTHQEVTIPKLQQKILAMHSENADNSDKIKKVERRLKTLAQHIQQAENYSKNRAIYKHYKAEKPKKQEAFYGAHSPELILYESAEKYLKAHLSGRDKIPLTAWKVETVELTTEKGKLYQQYYSLKEEVKKLEALRRSAEQVVGSEQKPRRNLEKEAEL